ncbi:MAG TPA: ZIP family metal transporter [Candidatus Krumholzibacteria bacterium]|nr:ZIP family metal transporter [Candidatus Krumholzibacteria bacterium]HPD72504.1 ZIP family metal transporter [Candidatus Krumholzibacteria bacterium]HRY40564.1 ZIP family metal transporter [Candidatus Krumholzibacteria bacterium]
MTTWLAAQPPILQALIGTLFTWGVTALGAATIFMVKEFDRRIMDIMLGFAAGVMIAASYWSLLAPAITMSENLGMIPWLPPAVGFLCGALFLRVADMMIPHLHLYTEIEHAEGRKTRLKKTILLVFAITLHNIPEGLAVGVAFGAAAAGLPSATIGAAIALAIGIGLQNFPEGAAVSFPIRREGFSRAKAFFYGQLSGVVEPIAGVVGAVAALTAQYVLPYALAFAAGAMIYVVVEEAIPESQTGGHQDAATMGTILGFVVMMTLDVALG